MPADLLDPRLLGRRLAYLVGELAAGPDARHRLQARLVARARRRLWRWRRTSLRRRQPGRPVVAIGLVEHLGDIVATEPIIRHLRREHPDGYLVWVVGHRYRELLEHHPQLDAVLPVGCLTDWILLRDAGVFDRVVDLHFHQRHCARCGIRLVKPDGGRGVTSDNYYALGNLLHAFCRIGGLPTLADAPELHVPAAPRAAVDRLALPPAYVAIHCASNETVRDWTADGWRELVSRILDLGRPVVEVGLRPVVGPARPGYVDLCGRLSILETAEVIRRAAAFVGIDSGPAHLANAVGTPGVIILGEYGPYRRYMPYSGEYASGRNATVLHADGPAAGTEVATVLDALVRALDASPPLAGAASRAAAVD